MSEEVKLYVKAGSDGQSLGDCPFCHKVILSLTVKNVPFELIFIDLSNKPDFFTRDINPKGSVPVAVLCSGEVIADSDEIIQKSCGAFYDINEDLHEKCNIMGAIVEYAKNKNTEAEQSVRDALVEKLVALNDYLISANTSFLRGDTFGYFDCKLVPFLNHVRVALHHYKGFEFIADDRYVCLVAYYNRAIATDIYRRHMYADSESIRGFSKFF